jgi:hypothetical protein
LRPLFHEIELTVLPKGLVTYYKPFKSWETAAVSPDWWSTYNNIKHHWRTHFRKASLENCLYVLGGLFAVLSAVVDFGGFHPWTAQNSKLFRLRHPSPIHRATRQIISCSAVGMDIVQPMFPAHVFFEAATVRKKRYRIILEGGDCISLASKPDFAAAKEQNPGEIWFASMAGYHEEGPDEIAPEPEGPAS